MDDKALTKRKNYHHGDLRAHLTEAIRTLVEAHGPDAFSIAEACRIAGVSTAAPYKHFADRGEMLRAVATGGMQRLRDGMRAAVEGGTPGDPGRVAAMGQAYVDFARAEPGVFRLVFGLAGDHAGDPDLIRLGCETEDIVNHVVGDHLGLSPDASETRMRAYALWCFVHGHSFHVIDGKQAEHAGDIDEGALLMLVARGMLPARTGPAS
jgi:AcrR family transcriptional regulator